MKSGTSFDRAEHWNRIYQTKAESELSWHQVEPKPSLELVRQYAAPGARIIDVGGGSSSLAGYLVSAGFAVTVLDVSAAAIERSKKRLGELGDRVRWTVGDVTALEDLGTFDLWHDRAVFHFLTEEEDQRRYKALAARSVGANGHLIVGTFALDGPSQCSGLPVERYDESKLASVFEPEFTLGCALQQTHVTPRNSPQRFLFAVLRKDV
jgi:2-polyprenyl-3-methyl-5-hydroxy-6-metoxy-1,4-benzoquinol methylase